MILIENKPRGDNMTIGEKIATLRKQNGMSQEVFSEKLGISRQAVSKWENGTAQPTSENLNQIAKLFGVTVSYLLDDEEMKTEEKPQEKPKNKIQNFIIAWPERICSASCTME